MRAEAKTEKTRLLPEASKQTDRQKINSPISFKSIMKIPAVSSKISAFLTSPKDIETKKHDRNAWEERQIFCYFNREVPQERIRHNSDFRNLKVISREFHGPIAYPIASPVPYRKQWAVKAYNVGACAPQETGSSRNWFSPDITPNNLLCSWLASCCESFGCFLIPLCTCSLGCSRLTASTCGTAACCVTFFAGAVKDVCRSDGVRAAVEQITLIDPVEARALKSEKSAPPQQNMP